MAFFAKLKSWYASHTEFGQRLICHAIAKQSTNMILHWET